MTDIINAFDAWMTDRYATQFQTKFYGFCELIKKTTPTETQPIPATITGTHKREQVALNDKYDLMSWVRIVNAVDVIDDIDGNDWAFGLDEGNTQRVNLRIVIAQKVELGENLIIDIARGMPSLFTISGYKIISVNKGTIGIDFDHEAIYTTELGNTAYERHRLTWNLYVINAGVEFIRCGDYDGDFRLTEGGVYRQIE